MTDNTLNPSQIGGGYQESSWLKEAQNSGQTSKTSSVTNMDGNEVDVKLVSSKSQKVIPSPYNDKTRNIFTKGNENAGHYGKANAASNNDPSLHARSRSDSHLSISIDPQDDIIEYQKFMESQANSPEPSINKKNEPELSVSKSYNSDYRDNENAVDKGNGGIATDEESSLKDDDFDIMENGQLKQTDGNSKSVKADKYVFGDRDDYDYQKNEPIKDPNDNSKTYKMEDLRESKPLEIGENIDAKRSLGEKIKIGLTFVAFGIVGAVAGMAIGVLAGGVGAIPGAVAGAVAGVKAGAILAGGAALGSLAAYGFQKAAFKNPQGEHLQAAVNTLNNAGYKYSQLQIDTFKDPDDQSMRDLLHVPKKGGAVNADDRQAIRTAMVHIVARSQDYDKAELAKKNMVQALVNGDQAAFREEMAKVDPLMAHACGYPPLVDNDYAYDGNSAIRALREGDWSNQHLQLMGHFSTHYRESMDFLIEIHDMKDAPLETERDIADFKFRLQEIRDRYVDPDSNQQVNVEGEYRAQLMDMLQDDNIRAMTADDLRDLQQQMKDVSLGGAGIDHRAGPLTKMIHSAEVVTKNGGDDKLQMHRAEVIQAEKKARLEELKKSGLQPEFEMPETAKPGGEAWNTVVGGLLKELDNPELLMKEKFAVFGIGTPKSVEDRIADEIKSDIKAAFDKNPDVDLKDTKVLEPIMRSALSQVLFSAKEQFGREKKTDLKEMAAKLESSNGQLSNA